MRLPAALGRSIEDELAQFDRKPLARAVEELSSSYRNLPKSTVLPANFLTNEIQRAAYLVTRVPATYAAIYSVLRELRERIPGLEVRSLLDLGAGPGTAMWAAAELFRELEQITLIEESGGFIRLGQRLAATAEFAAIQNARWVEANLTRETRLPPHDLVIISYALGELAPGGRGQLLVSASQAAAKVIAVVEPGTPRGFQVVLQARNEMLAQGAHLVAPCPHQNQCPMAVQQTQPAQNAKQDWCHFAQRLERTALHRRLKSGELGYEDEKFSYIAAAKQDVRRVAARVIRHPIQLKGHIKLELCTPEGLKQQTIARRQGESFKSARKAKWGEGWEPRRNEPREIHDPTP